MAGAGSGYWTAAIAIVVAKGSDAALRPGAPGPVTHLRPILRQVGLCLELSEAQGMPTAVPQRMVHPRHYLRPAEAMQCQGPITPSAGEAQPQECQGACRAGLSSAGGRASGASGGAQCSSHVVAGWPAGRAGPGPSAGSRAAVFEAARSRGVPGLGACVRR